METKELIDNYPAYDPESKAMMTLWRLWSFLTGEIDSKGPASSANVAENVPDWWGQCLKWPPDVFALCAAPLRRSGAYSAIYRQEGVTLLPADAAGHKANLVQICEEWRNYIESGDPAKNDKYFPVLREQWYRVWQCRYAPLNQVLGCPDLLRDLLNCLTLADEVCRSSGLPLPAEDGAEDQDKDDGKGASKPQKESKPPVSRFLVTRGWSYLEPNRYGSSLCTPLIHPTAARVLPRMHTPQSGLTMRSFSHHLAFCETDEVQPRWFMIPGARGEVKNQEHINLLIVPWPEKCVPAQFAKSGKKSIPVRENGNSGDYFKYEVQDVDDAAQKIDELCQQALETLGSLDGVVLPELALTENNFRAVRHRVLSRKLMLVTGVGKTAVGENPSENYLSVDVPLSSHHAVHFRQDKHHRWRLDNSQIGTYGIGARLHPEDSYWEDISIGDRRLLFLVLRPWLVTSVLICEDLARHDPVGELLRGVGPHLVIALLMDGPQLESRWSNRYATTLADDPGCSVLSVSSLGMVQLSRVDHLPPSRTVALWKDIHSVRRIDLDEGAAALALTITVKQGKEWTADGRAAAERADFPVLTGIHSIRLPSDGSQSRQSHSPRTLGFHALAEDERRRFLGAHEAADLARLVQLPDKGPAPALLREMTGEAGAIGKEIWRLKTKSSEAEAEKEMRQWRGEAGRYADLPTLEQAASAKEILDWHRTNKGRGRPRNA